jgi:hypothetical protein
MSMNFLNLLRTLEKITRPPRLGHDVDTVPCYFCGAPTDNVVDTDEGAEFICVGCATPGGGAGSMATDDGEQARWSDTAMFEPSDGTKLADMGRQTISGVKRNIREFAGDFFGDPPRAFNIDGTPNTGEPALTGDELVAVRGLIQERYSSEPSERKEHLGPYVTPEAFTDQPSPVEEMARRLIEARDKSEAALELIHQYNPDSAAPETAAGGEEASAQPPEAPSSPRSDLSPYNTTHCCSYCGCAGLVAHFDNCKRPK